MKRGLSITALLILAGLGTLAALAMTDPGESVRTDPSASIRASATSVDSPPKPPRAAQPPRPLPNRMRWLAFGGGAEPASSQVSIEQNLRLATGLLAERGAGALLFAGGPGAAWVQELDHQRNGDPVSQQLGELFAPRPDRSARYRLSDLSSHGAATLGNVRDAIDRAMSQRTAGSLLVVVAAHGDPGQTPRENAVVLWGGEILTAGDLAAQLDGAGDQARPVRLVMSTCFSGGFADVVFANAEAARGASGALRCGLFATTWDREASGCDPDPDRRAQESYSLYFYQALQGADRHGKPLGRGVVDLDGDGRISLLEAHTRVRMVSRSISIPTTTSERWLRHVAPRTGAERSLPLPEEDAVIAELGRVLQLRDAAAVAEHRRRLESQLDDALAELDDLARERDGRLADLQISLLERWPVIDDPYHPDYAATLTERRSPIRAALESEPPALEYARAQTHLDRLSQAMGQLEVRLALIGRLERAHENRTLAARLNAQGGPALQRYRALLSCERSPLGAD